MVAILMPGQREVTPPHSPAGCACASANLQSADPADRPARLEAARLALGLTQAQMARVLGYRRSNTWSDIERGVRAPGQATCRLLDAYLAGYRPPDWPRRRSV